MTRSWLRGAIGAFLLASSATGQEPTSDAAQKEAVAESIVAREESASDRAFAAVFRAKAKELLAALPLAELQSQTANDGLGLSGLGDSQADLVYTPVAPCRIIDTRKAGGPIAAGTTRSLKVTGDTTSQGGTNCGIPFGPATSAMINFVAVEATAPGDLRVTPFGTTMPLASILNWAGGVTGLNLANGLAVALCDPATTTCTNDITLQADASAIHIVADVQGYFQRVSSGGVGTALLADGAVTAPKVSSGVVVRSLNGLTDAVTLAAGSNVSITPSGSTLTISATTGTGGGDITAVNTPLAGGLQGGVTSGDANLGLVPCSATQLLKSDGTAWGCASDSDSGVNDVSGGGGITGSIAARTLTLGSTATATNTGGAIVARDGTGSFLAGSVGLAGNLALPNTTSASMGVLTKAGTPFLHSFGTNNVFVGSGAGNLALTGSEVSAFGNRALTADTTGNYNSAFGSGALTSNTTGSTNSAFGTSALSGNTTGGDNSAFGVTALASNTTGSWNAAFGNGALWQFSSGDWNTALGPGAGGALTSGSNNVYIGNSSTGSSEESNTIRIGNIQTATYIAGIYGQTSASGLAVYVASDGKLGTAGSSGIGDITAVNTPVGGGLQGGVTSGDANLGLLICGSGQVLKSGGSSWACATDADTGVNAVVGGGGVTGLITGRTLTLGSTATATNTGGAIVARDGTGSFLAGSVGLAGNLALPTTTSASAGVLTKAGTPFLHNFGTYNTFLGASAGNFTLTGTGNSAFGSAALSANTTGYDNSAFGFGALGANTDGIGNAALGTGALESNTTGVYNSAFGYGALTASTTGSYNAAFGTSALSNNTTASDNSAFGYHALANTTGRDNTAVGYQTLLANTTGVENSAFGYHALYANTTANYNTAFGWRALYSNTTGSYNSAFGHLGLYQLSSGTGNVAVGTQAGYSLTSGSYNVYIGNFGASSESNTTRIGYDGQTATYIAGIFGSTIASGVAVLVNSSHKLGAATSSRRYKEQIVDMDAESDVLLKLRPVSFYYRPELDETHLRQYGLVAEEVADVAPDLVVYDKDGGPQTVRYHFVNAMLLNEVQKQRRLVEEERRENEEQRTVIRDLEARLEKLEAALARNH